MPLNPTIQDVRHPLWGRVRQVERRSRQLVVWHGLAAFVAAIVPAVMTLAVVDYFLRPQDFGVRVILSATLLLYAAFCLRRYVLAAFRWNPSTMRVARSIESRFPQLQDRLSSCIDFLQANAAESGVGSPELRTALIEQTTTSSADLRFQDCLNPAPVRRMLLIAFCCCGALTVMAAMLPESFSLAARRMVMPWDDVRWPRWNDLAFVATPEKLASGTDFDIELVDRNGHLPDEVWLEYQFEGDSLVEIQSRLMKRVDHRMVANLSNVSRSFRLRARGGDDDSMPWSSVRVVKPPTVTSCSIEATPPAYSEQPVLKADQELTVLEGTRIAAKIELNKPVTEVLIQTNLSLEKPILPQFADDGRSFGLEFTVNEEWLAYEVSTIRFRLTDRDGISNWSSRECRLRVVADEPPQVSIVRPENGDRFTQNAMIPLRVVVRDDLRIDDVSLVAAESILDLQPFRATSPSVGSEDREWVIEFDWELQSLGLEEGDTLEFEVWARDRKPQRGKSDPRKVLIVSAEDWSRRFDQRRLLLEQQLRAVLKAQEAVRDQVRFLHIQVQEQQRLTADEVDYLEAAEMNQRHVRKSVEGSPDGLLPTVRALLRDLQDNRLESDQTAASLQQLERGLSAVSDPQLRGIENLVVLALKDTMAVVETKSTDVRTLQADLEGLLKEQESAITQFDELLRLLESWGNFQRFARELNELLELQDAVAVETRSSTTAGQNVRDLSTDERVELRQLAERQRSVSRGVERLLTEMRDAADRFEQASGRAGAALQEALEVARQQASAARSHQAAQSIERNRIGEASQLQTDVLASMEQMLAALTGNVDLSAGRAVQQLGESVQQLREMKQRQAELANDKPEGDVARAEWVQRQEQLAREAQQLARQFERLRQQMGQSAVQQAMEQMKRAADEMQSDGQEQALQQADAATQSLGQAERALEDQLNHLDRRLENLRRQQQVQEIQMLLARQQNLIMSLDQWQRATFVDAVDKSTQLEATTMSQAVLADDVEKQALMTGLERTFQYVLGRAADTMREASQLLAARDLSRGRQLQVRAAADLQRLLAAWERTESSQTPLDPAEGNQTTQSPENQEDGAVSLPELKLLRELQVDLNRRVDAIASTATSDEAVAELSLRYAEEQRQLAELVNEVLSLEVEKP